MVARQILSGVCGGAALAVLALLLTIPRSAVEKEVPAWLTGLFPEASAREQGTAGRAVGGEGAQERDRSSTANPLKKQGVGEEAYPGPRLASLGAGIGVVAAQEEDAPQLSSEEEKKQVEKRADELDPNLYVAVLSKQTVIRKEPSPESTILGFARTGALLRRAPIASGNRSCKGGWYLVEPRGYVCVGKTATLDPEHPVVRLASTQADRSLSMPYLYGKSRFPTPPFYTRIPTEKQQQRTEQDLSRHRKKNFGSLWDQAADVPPPRSLAEGQSIPRPFGYSQPGDAFFTGRALYDSAFAFIDMFESGGRRWGLTADLTLLPLDRLVPIKASEFSGVVVESLEDFPVVFVRSRVQRLYEGSPTEGTLKPTRTIAYREAFHLTGEEVNFRGTRFFETRDGAYVKEHSTLIRIESRESMPKWAKNDRSWIEVSILNQTLVAYRGKKPVFVTLVSTGKDGLGDPETTHSTVQGIFLIHTKHVTSSMSGDVVDDEFDLRDVPYVQYFHEGYAFHAAFWHDGFGQPRSHGCVNLSPNDARHLFSVSEPPVPLPWHSALDSHGTLVYIRP